MKNILFDFISLQDNFINGGMLYTEKILYELLDNSNVKIYGLINSRIQTGKRIERIVNKYNIELIDINNSIRLAQKIIELKIDVLFIGIAQRYNKFDLSGLKCKIYIVCHDVYDLSLKYSDVYKLKKNAEFFKRYSDRNGSVVKNAVKTILMPIIKIRRRLKNKQYGYDNFEKLIKKDNVYIITVSEYSKFAIEYFFEQIKNEVTVLYSPLLQQNTERISDDIITLVKKSKKYFLFVASDRIGKNPALFYEQWDRFYQKTNKEFECLLVGGKRLSVKKDGCVPLGFVNSSELNYLLENAFALIFPTFIEGFGCPPVEAAAYGVPSVCSNVTSVPEICGDMSIYFSPFYPEDLFKAMVEMANNREYYALKTKKRFLEITQKQTQDFETLKKLLME